MKDTVFIQFYSFTSWAPICIELGNGFSDTYDFCKSKGDIHWIKYYHDKEPNTEFIIDKGTAYISALYTGHLYTAYLWAKKYPEVKFIVGGPATVAHFITKKLPSNFILMRGSVEEWFGIQHFPCEWKLKLPEEVQPNDIIYFTYVLDNTCYWSKCIFCSCTIDNKIDDRFRKNLNFEFKNITHKGPLMIRLGTHAIQSQDIKNLCNLPKLSNLNGYRIFIRPSKKEFEALKSFGNLDWTNNIKFCMGLEFPTKRMWRYMNKGYRTETVLGIINLLKYNFHISMILGWNNLIKKDLEDLEDFMKRLPNNKPDTSIKIARLYVQPGTPMYDTHEKQGEDWNGPFYVGSYVKLNKEQFELNELAEEIIVKYSKEKNYFLLNLYNQEKLKIN